MFDVVVFLIENYSEKGVCLVENKAIVLAEMLQMGFPEAEVDRALTWLSGLEPREYTTIAEPTLVGLAFRHYLPLEEERLGQKAIGFLTYLEQLEILDVKTREIVIDRLMLLKPSELGLQSIQWVVLLALSRQPERRAALGVFEELVLTDAFGRTH